MKLKVFEFLNVLWKFELMLCFPWRSEFFPRRILVTEKLSIAKGQMKSECIYEIIDFPKYHGKNVINFCPEMLFKIGMLCTHLSRVALRIMKINHMYPVYKTFQGKNLSNFFSGIWKIDDFIIIH